MPLLSSTFLALATQASGTSAAFRWLRHLGGPGLILLGLVDNSVIPIPGSMDVFLVVLAAGQRDWWPYYSFMATLGSVIGGFLTYRLARREGKEQLSKRVKRSQMEKVHAAFEKWGFLAITVPALIPPPFPMTPFLIAAGAAQYSRNRFAASLFLGRGVRYAILGVLAAFYGSAILGFFSEHKLPIIATGIALMLAGVGFAVFRSKYHRSKHA